MEAFTFFFFLYENCVFGLFYTCLGTKHIKYLTIYTYGGCIFLHFCGNHTNGCEMTPIGYFWLLLKAQPAIN